MFMNLQPCCRCSCCDYICRTEAYDPSKTGISSDTLAAFVSGEVEGPLTQVPGVGPAAVSKLNAAGIYTTFQLIGKFLSFKGVGSRGSARAICDALFHYLAEIGITSHRNSIVQALAEKLNTLFPGLYSEADL